MLQARHYKSRGLEFARVFSDCIRFSYVSVASRASHRAPPISHASQSRGCNSMKRSWQAPRSHFTRLADCRSSNHAYVSHAAPSGMSGRVTVFCGAHKAAGRRVSRFCACPSAAGSHLTEYRTLVLSRTLRTIIASASGTPGPVNVQLIRRNSSSVGST